MRARISVFAVAFVAMLAGSLIQAAPASAQVRIGVGVGVGYYRPYYGPWFSFGYSWYPGFYYGYPYYGYPFYGYPYARSYYGYPYYGYPGGYPYYYGASLRLQVTPREAEVFVDGYFAGTVDDFDGTFQRLDAEPGEHDLELYLPGHRSVQQKLYLQPGKTTKVKLAMQPLAPGDSEPVRPVGVPSSSRLDARNGAPRPRRQPRADDVTPVEPTRDRDATYGSLSIRVQPGDAEILIDGERWEGPATTERFVVGLAAGRHVIEIQKPGFRRYTTEVTVRNGVTTPLNVLLTPSP